MRESDDAIDLDADGDGSCRGGTDRAPSGRGSRRSAHSNTLRGKAESLSGSEVRRSGVLSCCARNALVFSAAQKSPARSAWACLHGGEREGCAHSSGASLPPPKRTHTPTDLGGSEFCASDGWGHGG